MKKILILGSGAGGTMVANNLRKKLSPNTWEITILDNDEIHHYQPGWLFIPFGVYTPEDCQKPKREFIPEGVKFVLDEVTALNTDSRTVEGKKGKYSYDWLIIATGCTIVPEEVEGMVADYRKKGGSY
jgi:sulfide:quinone oxidoreductase